LPTALEIVQEHTNYLTKIAWPVLRSGIDWDEHLGSLGWNDAPNARGRQSLDIRRNVKLGD